MLRTIKARGEKSRTAGLLCTTVCERARDPVFFRDYQVADTFDGRFDVLVLHAWLVLERLRAQGEETLAQYFVDALFVRLEEALREQGAGDMGMSRRIKKMASAFYGRLAAYDEASDAEALAAALARNLYRGDDSKVEAAAGLAKYVLEAGARLAESGLDQGKVDFGRLPARMLT